MRANRTLLVGVPLVLVLGCSLATDEPIAPDALSQMPPAQLAAIKTAAGTLHCAADLCTTQFGPGTKADGPDWLQSKHTIRLTAGGMALDLHTSEGPSGDPSYEVGS